MADTPPSEHTSSGQKAQPGTGTEGPVRIRLGGVPEHFNLPVHEAFERGAFAERGVDLAWQTYAGGTGQMTRALREGEVDACILLTEGAIADRMAGAPIRIISSYVVSPLTWGIHTGTASALQHHAEIYTKRYAISRFGSGSHLMAIVDAVSREHHLNEDQFIKVGNLDGALASLESGETAVFYWEKYTTKPYVDAGRLRRIGEFLTPWPCFVVAATEDILQREPKAVIRMLRTMHDACDRFMQDDQAPARVAKRYGLQARDAEAWYHRTEWAIHGWVSDKMMASVVYHLREAGIVPQDQEAQGLVWERP